MPLPQHDGPRRRLLLIAACTALLSAGQDHIPELGPPRDIAFTAEIDGSEQRYVERLPLDFDATRTTHLLVALHGHGSDRWQYAQGTTGSIPAARAVAARHKMVFVSPDYRAKTSWMGPRAEADVVQIIGILKATYAIDKVFLVGGSMGGSSVLTFGALHPDLVSGIVSCNGTANHLEYENFQDAIRESFGGTKKQLPLEYKKRSAEYFPEAFTMPLAICAGGNDTVVPADSVLRLATIVKKLNRNTLVIYRKDGEHSTPTEDAALALDFVLARSLGLPYPPGSHAVATGGVFCGDTLPEATNAPGTVELGVGFTVTKPGKLQAFRFYQAASESGAHELRLWTGSGDVIRKETLPEEPGEGWYAVTLSPPLSVQPGQEFVLSYTASTHYPATPGVFEKPIVRQGITAQKGLYSFDSLDEMPTQTYLFMSYFLDVDYASD